MHIERTSSFETPRRSAVRSAVWRANPLGALVDKRAALDSAPSTTMASPPPSVPMRAVDRSACASKRWICGMRFVLLPRYRCDGGRRESVNAHIADFDMVPGQVLLVHRGPQALQRARALVPEIRILNRWRGRRRCNSRSHTSRRSPPVADARRRGIAVRRPDAQRRPVQPLASSHRIQRRSTPLLARPDDIGADGRHDLPGDASSMAPGSIMSIGAGRTLPPCSTAMACWRPASTSSADV